MEHEFNMKGFGTVYYEVDISFSGRELVECEVIRVFLDDVPIDELPEATQAQVTKAINNQIENYIESTKDYDPD